MSAQASPKLAAEQYLAIERAAEFKSEFYRGEMFAMAGGSEPHSAIVGNFAGELRVALKARPCRVYSADLRLRVSPESLHTYPDVMVICGERKFADDRRDTVVNPVVIVEVLSPSTESYDRGRKFAEYRTIESFQEYVLVSQTEPRVERFRRQPEGGWMLNEYAGLEAVLAIESLDCRVPLAEIYDKVEFPAASSSVLPR